MQDAIGGNDAARATAARGDWAQIIRARLAGSQPRHRPEDWLMPALWQPGSNEYRRFFPSEPVPAAVLIPLVERPELTMLFTQRATQLRNHAGQISFPGGRIEAGDGTPKAAALREAREEIGLDERFISVIGYLQDHLVVTGFRVTPVVAFVQPGFELLLASEEVEDTFEVPVSYLFDPANHVVHRRRGLSGEWIDFRDIPFGERTIWGATAGMLLTLYRLCTGPEAA
ncbi:MAG TPA: CoA pyrophosphatase [Steroidobacteraceae bacterium]|nr:CoA pyrophosphatase [Steroidobacteraceae bacterium]